MSARIRQYSRFLFDAGTLAVVLLAAACDGSSDGAKAGGEAGGAVAENSAPSIAAPPRKTPGVKEFVYDRGRRQDWALAAAHLAQLDFVGGGAGHSQRVRLCRVCDFARVVIRPEKGAQELHPADFDSLRVIASVVLKEKKHVPALGIGEMDQTAYLVVTSKSSAAFMYRIGDSIAFSPSWRFVPNTNGRKPGPRAQWVPRPHVHGPGPMVVAPDSAFVSHLAEAWIACAEGCCTAQSLQ